MKSVNKLSIWQSVHVELHVWVNLHSIPKLHRSSMHLALLLKPEPVTIHTQHMENQHIVSVSHPTNPRTSDAASIVFTKTVSSNTSSAMRVAALGSEMAASRQGTSVDTSGLRITDPTCR